MEHSLAGVVAAGHSLVGVDAGAGHSQAAEEAGADHSLPAAGAAEEAGADHSQAGLAGRIHLVVVVAGVVQQVEAGVAQQEVRVVVRGMELVAHRELLVRQRCQQTRAKLRKL